VLVVAMVDPIDYQASRTSSSRRRSRCARSWPRARKSPTASRSATARRNRIGTFLANVPEVQDIKIMSEDPQEVAVDLASTKSAAEVGPS